MRCHMKNCFIKLNKLSADDMIKIWKITLDSTKENLWEKRISTCSESKYNGSEDRDLKVYWNEEMEFITNLILPDNMKEFVSSQDMNMIPPFHEMDIHIDGHRDALIYLPIYPIKEDYMPMRYYHNNEEILLDNYDIGQVYLCNTKIIHRIHNNSDLPRYNYQISLKGKEYENMLYQIT